MALFKIEIHYTTLNGNVFYHQKGYKGSGDYPHYLYPPHKQITNLHIKTLYCDDDISFILVLDKCHLKNISLHKDTIEVYCDNIKICGSIKNEGSMSSILSNITFYC